MELKALLVVLDVKELLVEAKEEVSKDVWKFLLALWMKLGWSVVNFDTKSKRLMFLRQYIWESFCITDIFSGRVSSIDMISTKEQKKVQIVVRL